MSQANELHQKAIDLAKNYLLTEGQLLTVLMEIRRKRLFAVLNYANIFDYCERALNLSRAQAYYFKTVAEKSETVPELKEAIDQGELTLSEARRIAPVITKENSNEWIAKAKELPQAQLERAVTEVNPKKHIKERVRPVAKELSELRVAVDPKTEENLSALKDLLSQKLKKPATLGEVIAYASELAREKLDPERKAARAKISSGNPPKPGRHPIPAVVKHKVVQKQGNRCCYVSEDGRRCEQRRWLQHHHVVPVSQGGLNDLNNLEILCSEHHFIKHRKN